MLEEEVWRLGGDMSKGEAHRSTKSARRWRRGRVSSGLRVLLLLVLDGGVLLLLPLLSRHDVCHVLLEFEAASGSMLLLRCLMLVGSGLGCSGLR